MLIGTVSYLAPELVVDGRADTRADVYAAGDVAFAFNTAAGRHVAVEHWQDAVDHGDVAGAQAAGVTATWHAVPGFWSTIGDTAVKYHAWGDGYDASRVVDHDDRRGRIEGLDLVDHLPDCAFLVPRGDDGDEPAVAHAATPASSPTSSSSRRARCA